MAGWRAIGLAVSLSFVVASLAGCGGGGGSSTGPIPSPPDVIPPVLSSVNIADNAAGVAVDGFIRASFSEPVDPATVTAGFTLYAGGGPVPGTVAVSPDRRTATFTPSLPLDYFTVYTVSIRGIRDLSGNPIASDYTATFTTRGFIQGMLAPDNTLAVSLAGAAVRDLRPSDDLLDIVSADNAAVDGDSGAFSFGPLGPGKHFFVAEKRFLAGPVGRILGVATFFLGDTPAALQVPVSDVTPTDASSALDVFCLDCHPPWGQVTRAGQIVRCAHVSGIVSKYYPRGNYDEFRRITCESCHSVHVPTGVPHFVLLPYDDPVSGSVLCLQCH